MRTKNDLKRNYLGLNVKRWNAEATIFKGSIFPDNLKQIDASFLMIKKTMKTNK